MGSHAVSDVVQSVECRGGDRAWDRAEAGAEPGLDKTPEEDRLKETYHQRHREQGHPIDGRRQPVTVKREEELDRAQDESKTNCLPPVLPGQAKIGQGPTPQPDRVDHRPDHTQDEACGEAEKQSQRPAHGEHLERQIEGRDNTDVEQ